MDNNSDKENNDVSKIFEMLAEHDNMQNTATGKAKTLSIFTRLLLPFLMALVILTAMGNEVSILTAVSSILSTLGIGIVWAIIHDNTGMY